MLREEGEEGEKRNYDAPMLRKEEEEGNRIKGLRKLKCPNHLGDCYNC
jgi:hypothetical protein